MRDAQRKLTQPVSGKAIRAEISGQCRQRTQKLKTRYFGDKQPTSWRHSPTASVKVSSSHDPLIIGSQKEAPMRLHIGTIAIALMSAAPVASAKDLTLPDPDLTPGVARALSVDVICKTKWGKDARHVTAAMKKQVFQNYGLTGNNDPSCIADKSGRHCEVDHLISRELGGAGDAKNLRLQPYGSSPWNAALKDRVENRLHKEVCAKTISLARARREIKTDWHIPYRRYFGKP